MNLSDFDNALIEAGIGCTKPLCPDGKIHRFTPPTDKQENGWYVLFDHGNFLYACYGCWKRGLKLEWSSADKSSFKPEEWQKIRDSIKSANEQRKSQEIKDKDEARKRCASLFASAPLAPSDHPYLVKKGVRPHGKLYLSTLETYTGWLAIPLQDETGTIHSAQFIADDGTKKFAYHGRIQGCFFWLHKDLSLPIVICEGYATGASIHEATGWSVICAMNCGNLAPVAKSIRSIFPASIIVIAGDNDIFTEANPGATKAREASKSQRTNLALPMFPEPYHDQKPTDFNDLHRLGGLDEVKTQLQRSFTVFARSIADFQLPPENDINELLKYRYLCNHGSLLINGPTGIGKSSLLVQAAACWANGMSFFGLEPTRPLSTLIIQAENDDGDVAEMRDGICYGLKFTTAQRAMFYERVMIHTSSGITGLKFCTEVVSPLTSLNKPNILGIDPALSFLGGDVKDQKDVGEFLRTYLNPILRINNCGCCMLHHTNKPASGKEKSSWRNGEFAYSGSGSAEWANWARAILSLQDTGTHGVYNLHAAKRGARLTWKDDADQKTYSKVIKHATEKGVICWYEGQESDIDALETPTRKGDTSKADLIALLPPSSPMEKDVLISKAQGIGIGIQRSRLVIAELVSESRLFEWRYPRENARPKIAICKEPPPDEYK